MLVREVSVWEKGGEEYRDDKEEGMQAILGSGWDRSPAAYASIPIPFNVSSSMLPLLRRRRLPLSLPVNHPKPPFSNSYSRSRSPSSLLIVYGVSRIVDSRITDRKSQEGEEDYARGKVHARKEEGWGGIGRLRNKERNCKYYVFARIFPLDFFRYILIYRNRIADTSAIPGTSDWSFFLLISTVRFIG